MARPKKQHRPGGIYYVVLFGNGGRQIFFDDADKDRFLDLLVAAQLRCNVEIFAFCLTKQGARLVVRVADVPVGRLVQRLATQYSRGIHLKYASSGYLFQHPYRAHLLEGTRHLLEIVRHVHLAPLESLVTLDLDSYRWCSHRDYLGLSQSQWLEQRPVFELLGPMLADPLHEYRQFVAGKRARDATVGGGDLPPHSTHPSDDLFFMWLRQHPNKPVAAATIEQIIAAVVKKMGVDREKLLSPSRERRLTLARALIGWHVTSNRIGTLTEVARQLGRDPSSIYTAYARYRAWRPQLFRDSLATILQYLDTPAEPVAVAPDKKKH